MVSVDEIRNMTMSEYAIWRNTVLTPTGDYTEIKDYDYYRELYVTTGDWRYFYSMLEKVDPNGW